MRALIIGYFTTVGDIEVLRQVERQLYAGSVEYDVASYSAKIWKNVKGWVDIRQVDPFAYTHLLVVCGPFYQACFVRRGIDLDRFSHCTRVGVNLTMIEKLDDYDPLDVLLGRDSDQWHYPDLSFLECTDKVPVAGICLVHKQGEYGARQMHDKANDSLRRLAKRAHLATIELDTEWPGSRNANGLSSPTDFESVCARVDVMLTTRLHGMVLSLKNGVPVIAVDAIAGGGKVGLQAGAVGWPEVFAVNDVTDDDLDAALARCLTPAARDRAHFCSDAARKALVGFSTQFKAALDTAPQGKPSFTAPAPAPIWKLALGHTRRRLSKMLFRILGVGVSHRPL
jgi:hypothetical protein